MWRHFFLTEKHETRHYLNWSHNVFTTKLPIRTLTQGLAMYNVKR